jgi:hypothetical protein
MFCTKFVIAVIALKGQILLFSTIGAVKLLHNYG